MEPTTLKIYFSWDEANKDNLFTKTTWAKKGYVLKKDAKPVATYCQSTLKAKVRIINGEPERTIHQVISRDGDILTVVDVGYDLYSIERVELRKKAQKPKAEQSVLLCDNVSICLPSSPSPSSLPFVSPKGDEICATPCETGGFSVINAQKPSFQQFAYVPETFNPDDEAKLGALKEEAFCVFHLLHFLRVTQNRDRDAWIDLAWNLCESIFGKRTWSAVRDLLLHTEILEKTTVETNSIGLELPRGQKGYRAYGYRFANPAYRHATFRLRLLTREVLCENLHQYRTLKKPVHRWLKEKVMQVEIVDVPDNVLLAAAKADYQETQAGTIEGRVFAYREMIRCDAPRILCDWKCQIQ